MKVTEIRAYRDDADGAASWRKAQPVRQQLARVKLTETGRRCVTQIDKAEELVVGWIGNRDSVRVLIRRANAIAMTDRDIRSGNSERRLGPRKQRVR
jgi:hypothetical protein